MFVSLGATNLHRDHDERNDDCNKGDAVQSETPRRAEEGIRQAAESRADDACKIELDRVHRNRIGKVLQVPPASAKAPNKRVRQRTARGQPRKTGSGLPDRDGVGGEQHCQYKGAGHLNVLRIEQHPLPVQAVGEDPTDKRKENDGQLPQEEIQPKVKGILGEVVDKPALCELLHKCTNGGNARSQPHDPEITVSKRSEDSI